MSVSQTNEKRLFRLFNELSEKNDEHVEDIAEELEQHVEGQDPAFTTVVCSDSRVRQQELWKNNDLGEEFTVGVIGNHVNEASYWDDSTVSGNIDYIPEHTKTPTGVVVIGHTGCGAVTATYETMKAIVEEDNDIEKASQIMEYETSNVNFSFTDYTGETEGINTHIALLMDSGLDEAYDNLRESEEELDDHEMVNRLVEKNVDNQIEYLKKNSEYENTEFFGAVYDMEGSYSDEHGRLYLTNFDGETQVKNLEDKFANYPGIEIKRQDQHL